MKKTTKRKTRKKQPSMLRKLRAKTQSATVHLTHEDDWDTEVPNVRLSRVFAIVLILHIVAVGGILAFQLLNPEGASSSTAANTPPAREDAAAKKIREGLVSTQPKPPKIGDPAMEGLKHWRVQSGDTLPAIARRFSVPIEELERLNKLDAGNNLYPGLLLYIPNRTVAATKPREIEQLLASARGAIIEPNNKRATPGTRVPLAMEEMDRPVRRPVGVASVPKAQIVRPIDRPASASSGLGRRAEATRQRVVESRPAGQSLRGTVKIYTVAAGDTAYGLGRKFGISHSQLLEINGIDDPKAMRVGMQLKVPVQN